MSEDSVEVLRQGILNHKSEIKGETISIDFMKCGTYFSRIKWCITKPTECVKNCNGENCKLDGK